MQSFVSYMPTEVIFGKNTEDRTAEFIKKHRGSRIFIVYGGGSVVKSGLLSKIEQQLIDADLDFLSFGGIKPNPTLETARECVKKAIKFGADFVLAIGGGSVIDTAKAVAHGVKAADTDIWSFWSNEKPVVSSLPVGVVLTISAAGSEMSNSAVLTNEEIGQKKGLSTDFNRPVFAIMNPELTYTLPKFQIACGIVDIMMHTLDRFFTTIDGNQLTDEFALGLLRIVVKNGKIAMLEPTNYEAMSEIMWCGSVSHNGFTGLGYVLDFAVHQLGHEISAKYDVAHGASLSAVWESWAKHVYKIKPERFAQYGRYVWGIDEKDDNQAALNAISTTMEFFKSLNMPTNFSSLGIELLNENELLEMSDRCTYRGKRLVGNFKKLDKDDIYAIYKMANN